MSDERLPRYIEKPWCDGWVSQMKLHDEGPWVRYDDYRALAARCEQERVKLSREWNEEYSNLQAKLAASMKSHALTSAAYIELRQDYDRLSRQFKEAQTALTACQNQLLAMTKNFIEG